MVIKRSFNLASLAAVAAIFGVANGCGNVAVDAADPVDAADASQSDDSGASTWNQWRGPTRDGVWSGGLPETLADVSLAWEKPLAPSYSGPVANRDTVFTTETVDESFERVTAYDLKTGAQRWTARWDGAMTVPPFAAANGSWIKATPALDDDALVVLGIRDELVCLDPDTGEKRWQVDLAERFDSRRPMFGAVCSPIIDGDAIYVQGGGATLKLDKSNGQTIWRTLADQEDDDAFSSPILATIAGVKQLVVQTRTELCGVSVDDGSLLWSEPIEAFRNMNVLTPTIIDDAVFTAAHSGRSQMFDVTLADGQWTLTERWNQKIQAYMSSPVVLDQTIYLHAKSDRLTAMDVASGEILWTDRPLGKYQSLVRSRDAILALVNTGELLLIKPSREQLDVIDRRQVADDSWAYLAMIEGGFVVRDLDALKVYRW